MVNNKDNGWFVSRANSPFSHGGHIGYNVCTLLNGPIQFKVLAKFGLCSNCSQTLGDMSRNAGNEMHAPFDKHHKVSSFQKSH